MIYLNLLPYKFRKELRLRYLYQILVRQSFIIVFVLLVLSGFFYASGIILNNFYEVVDSTNFLMGNQVKEPISVTEVNTKINKVANFTQGEVSWVEVIGSSTSPFKDKICLNSLEIIKDSGKVYIQGVAQDRDALINLKTHLEDSDYFSQVNLPIKNFFQREDINFEMESKLNIN